MAGLDPAINVFASAEEKQDVVARDKRGHDGELGYATTPHVFLHCSNGFPHPLLTGNGLRSPSL
jgi:hypothetical protein